MHFVPFCVLDNFTLRLLLPVWMLQKVTCNSSFELFLDLCVTNNARTLSSQSLRVSLRPFLTYIITEIDTKTSFCLKDPTFNFTEKKLSLTMKLAKAMSNKTHCTQCQIVNPLVRSEHIPASVIAQVELTPLYLEKTDRNVLILKIQLIEIKFYVYCRQTHVRSHQWRDKST